MDATLTAREFQLAGGTQDWRVLGRGACAWFEAPSHATGDMLARRVMELCEGQGWTVPDLDIRPCGIRVYVDYPPAGFTDAEVALAGAISTAAAELGLRADPAAVQDVQLTFDTLDQSSVMDFWGGVLGHERRGEDDLIDPARRLPPLWFQDQDAPRPLRNRLHLDVVTASEVAVATLASARAAGAAVREHGYYATVADPEGNEVDILPLPEGSDRWTGQDTEDWRLVFSAVACYATPSMAASMQLAEAVARLADAADLSLGIDVRPDLVTLDSGKDAWELDDGYEQLAARIQEAARAMGLTADTARPRFVQVGIDAVDIPAVRGFWRAVLGYEEDGRDHVTDIVDPQQLNMPLFFQDLEPGEDARRAQRNRIHLDVYLPDDLVRARVDAGLAAGGKVLYEAKAPLWWTLSDPEGNEVDLCVSVGREEMWAPAPS
ncbi:MAG: VOC family protein [Ornithinimicrobium sp.]|uniref:VOC family protein n=1 Tax=Ornithinimicrobium sp. TaxID=1977084 RepID=UPI0026DF65C3|nr:VOC family protein [Ornithinimicrobium sp.]MDO5738798.1 VOC family protein [Ornithinimicrobium sp.]